MLRRLEEVTAELGTAFAEVRDAKSVGEEVLIAFALRGQEADENLEFFALVEVEAAQMTKCASSSTRGEALAAAET